MEPFPPTGERHELLISGANISAHKIGWSATTAELFYVPRILEFEAAPFATRPTFKFGDARKVPRPFGSPGAPNMRTHYDITPKGTFVGLFVPGDVIATMLPPVTHISLILNWIRGAEGSKIKNGEIWMALRNPPPPRVLDGAQQPVRA